MSETNSGFSGGLNSDNSPIFQPKNSYVDGLNIEIINDELQGSIAISNSRGNKFQKSIPDMGDIYRLSLVLSSPSVGLITINGVDDTFTVTATTTYEDLYNFILDSALYDLTE